MLGDSPVIIRPQRANAGGGLVKRFTFRLTKTPRRRDGRSSCPAHKPAQTAQRHALGKCSAWNIGGTFCGTFAPRKVRGGFSTGASRGSRGQSQLVFLLLCFLCYLLFQIPISCHSSSSLFAGMMISAFLPFTSAETLLLLIRPVTLILPVPFCTITPVTGSAVPPVSTSASTSPVLGW